MTKLLRLTHVSTGPEALLYALLIRQHLITAEFFVGLKALFPTKKRKEAAAVRQKLMDRASVLLDELYPGHDRINIETLSTKDIVDDALYPRYLVKITYPVKPGTHNNL